MADIKSIVSNNHLFRSAVRPIFLILLLAFALRLIDVNVTAVSWRQADTAAMARNFYENRYNILYPQIDWSGGSSGYVESEFPVYSFAVASLYKIFGVHEAIARLLSAVLSVASIYFVYLFARELLGKPAAFWSACFFAFLPLQIFYGRAIMPEPLLTLGIAAGVYFFYRWYLHGRLADILLSAGFTAVACLIKPQTLYLFLPLAFLAWLRYRNRFLLQPHLWLFTAVVVLPLAVWYYHAHQLYLETGLTFGIWGYGSDKWGNWDLLLTLDFWKTILWDHLARPLAYVGFLLLEIGLVMKRRRREEYMLDVWMVALLFYVILVARGNYAHEYYLLPAMVPIALLMGKVCGRYLPYPGMKQNGDGQSALNQTSVIGQKSAFGGQSFPRQQSRLMLLVACMAVISAVIFISSLRQEHDLLHRLDLAGEIQRQSKPDDLIVTVDSMDPTLLYLSHRKGWAISSTQMHGNFPGASFIAGYNYDQSFIHRL